MANEPILWWDIVKVVLLLTGMVVLGRYTPTIMRKFQFTAEKRQRHMQLLDTLYLGTERSVHLVEVDGVRLVLGASRNGINLLTQVPKVEATAGQVEAEAGDTEPGGLTTQTAQLHLVPQTLAKLQYTQQWKKWCGACLHLVKSLRTKERLRTAQGTVIKLSGQATRFLQQVNQREKVSSVRPTRKKQTPAKRGKAGKGAAKSSRHTA